MVSTGFIFIKQRVISEVLDSSEHIYGIKLTRIEKSFQNFKKKLLFLKEPKHNMKVCNESSFSD